MIKDISLENFGPLSYLNARGLGRINVIIGGNGAGKTFLLKSMYAAVRSLEEANRGHDRRDFSEVLSDKIYWTFQADKLGDLVSKGEQNRLKMTMTQDDNSSLVFEFGPDTSKKVQLHLNNLSSRDANSIFLPPKEVLSLSKVIIKTALHDKTFGFDSTYVDLVLALQAPLVRGRNSDAFKQSRVRLEGIFQGKLEYDSSKDSWIYKKGNSRFSINATAEGVKKIAILDTLLANRYISPGSIVFVDEPESALHPAAISQLMEIVVILAEKGIQFFIATHSYFVVKKLHILSLKNSMVIPVLMADSSGEWTQTTLTDGMPSNSIIEESIRLFEEEMEVVSS